MPPLGPDALRREVAAGLRRVAERQTVLRRSLRSRPARGGDPAGASRGPGLTRAVRRSCRRCSPISSPPAATSRGMDSGLGDRRAVHDPSRGAGGISLLNLVNFGGGCYAVYAELRGDRVHVDKELFGDTFRSPPRLTPLEARAIRLALEVVGPMIAADAQTPSSASAASSRRRSASSTSPRRRSPRQVRPRKA